MGGEVEAGAAREPGRESETAPPPNDPIPLEAESLFSEEELPPDFWEQPAAPTGVQPPDPQPITPPHGEVFAVLQELFPGRILAVEPLEPAAAEDQDEDPESESPESEGAS